MAQSSIYQIQWADQAIFNCAEVEIRAQDRQNLRAQLGAGSEAKVVLFVGRLERQKDPLFLLESFGLLQQRRAEIWLAVAGTSRLEGQLQAGAPLPCQHQEVNRKSQNPDGQPLPCFCIRQHNRTFLTPPDQLS